MATPLFIHPYFTTRSRRRSPISLFEGNKFNETVPSGISISSRSHTVCIWGISILSHTPWTVADVSGEMSGPNRATTPKKFKPHAVREEIRKKYLL